MTDFPVADEAARMAMFADRPGPVRVLFDTDAANEIDDQFALAWALLSPDRLQIEAAVAEPFSFAHLRPALLEAAAAERRGVHTAAVDKVGNWASNLLQQGMDPALLPFTAPDEGMELSYREILTVYDKLGVPADGLVFRGADRYLTAPDVPVESEGAQRIIEAALADDDRPLFVVAIGCVTNVASALLMAPEIATRMVVTWTAGYPTWMDLSNEPSLNLVQDPHASRLLFSSGVPLAYLPGYHIGAQLRLSRPEMEAWVAGKGAIGDYLYHLYTHNPIHAQRGIRPFPGQSWVIWDLINVAWLLERDWVPSRPAPAPLLGEDLRWRPRADGPLMMEAYEIDRDAIFKDLLAKLDDQERILEVYG